MVDEGGRSALISAARESHEAVVLLLLEISADINEADRRGWTALISAACSGHEAVVRALLDAGVDVDTADAGDRKAPI